MKKITTQRWMKLCSVDVDYNEVVDHKNNVVYGNDKRSCELFVGVKYCDCRQKRRMQSVENTHNI